MSTYDDVLIAEDLLLLLLDDEKGSLAHATYLDTGLGGALLVELSLGRHVEPVAQEKSWGFTPKDRIRVTGTIPRDELLRAAYEVVQEKERPAQELVARLGRKRREPMLERLVERGILRREDGKVLGLFPRTTWPEADGRREGSLRERLHAVLVEGHDPDDRTGALVAVLSGMDAAHRVLNLRGGEARDVKQRARTVAEGDWAAAGVKDAVASAQAAMTAAAVTTTVVVTGS